MASKKSQFIVTDWGGRIRRTARGEFIVGDDVGETDVVATVIIDDQQRGVGVSVAQPLPADRAWTTVIVFRVDTGDTRLVAHAVLATPRDWDTCTRESDVAMKWLVSTTASLWPGEMPVSGQLSTRLVRSASIGDLERLGRWLIHAARGQMTLPREVGAPEIKTRRRRRDETELARIAGRYAELATQVSSPSKALAEEMHLSRDRMRKLIAEARDRGLLTEATKGRAGGTITTRAREVLEEERSNAR